MRYGALAAVLALAVSPAAAQDGVDVGIKAGLNLATLSGSGLLENLTSEFERLSAPMAGVYARVPLGSRLALQPEALYSRKGAELDITIGRVKVQLDYLDLALPLRVDLVEDGPVRPYLLAGPYVGVKLNAELVLNVLLNFDTDIDDRVRDTDVGVLGGAGLRFPAGSTNLEAEARYGLGLSRVNADIAGSDVKNRVFTVSAGITF